jgi:hypothetical protein
MTPILVGKKTLTSWLYHAIEMGGKMKSLENSLQEHWELA